MASQHHQNFRYALLFISVLAYLCCPDRSDFNLPLGIWAFLLWSDCQFPQKHRIIWMLIISLGGDLLWILFISFIRWNKDDNLNQAAKDMHQLIRIISIINLVYKLVLIIYAVNKIEGCKDLLNKQSIQKKTLAY